MGPEFSMQLWLLKPNEKSNIKFITWAMNREAAKRKAGTWIGGNADNYIVEPLTMPGDRVKLDIVLSV